MESHSGIPTFVINLLSDAARRDNVTKQFVNLPAFDMSFVVGAVGRDLPNEACFGLTRSENWIRFKGTIGCFLSHVKAWEEAAHCASPFAVILEDDVDLSQLGRLTSLTIPPDAEIIFLNDRLTADLSPLSALHALPLWRALKRVDRLRCGPGGDGYLLTPACAAKLVAACRKDLFYGHVDGRLLRYATGEDDLAELPNDSWIAGVIRNHHHATLKPTLGLVRGYCLSEPLVKHRGIVSTRETADQALRPKST